MPQMLKAILPYIPPGLARSLMAAPVLTPCAEQFRATVLFADISGFTSLTEALAKRGAEGPEEMTRLLNAYFSRLISAIESEGGEVVKFSGDALTALFPATDEPAGHAARRAVQAAGAMQALMGDFADLPTSAGHIALAVKIGIGTGTVHAFRVGGILERWEYVVAGDPISQVAEAEHAAVAGQTILSPATAALLADPATPPALPPRALQAAQIASVADLRATAKALRGFVPGALRVWLGQDVQEGLAALRPMSVLFIGVSGLDYEAPSALDRLQAFLASVQEVIYRYEGSINKLAVDDKGTILLAMFGAPPFAHTDNAARATRAALDLLATTLAPGMVVSVGVATGPVFAGSVGSVGRREYTVMGDTVNRAARLMAAAGPGDIRCDFATTHESRRVMAFETLAPVHLKGKAGLAQVFRPTGLAHPREPSGATLVGRHEERAHFKSALDEIQAGGQRLLLIEGEAGMGKSRLLEELVRLCREKDHTVLAGAGHSSEPRTPYRAWRDIFHAYFALDGVDDPAERQRIVHARVAEFAPRYIERLPLLNDFLGVAFPETALTGTLDAERRHQGRKAFLTELLGRWAAEGPLVLILEDVHWMDTSSWGLAFAVVSGLRSARLPLLMVMSMRPIEPGNRPAEFTSLAALEGTVQVALTALGPEETDTLVARQLGLCEDGLPAALAELVRARADGNPFFVEEIIQALCDEGLLSVIGEAGQRRCVLNGGIDEVARRLPETIQNVVLSRIDRLAPGAQMLLRVGSVIGRSFRYEMLRAALSHYEAITEAELKGHLEQLAGLDLTPQESPDPDLRHAFRHAITHEVAYGTMLFAQRRELHRRVAQWYEAQFAPLDDVGGGEPPEVLGAAAANIVHLLAFHYQRSGDGARERHYAALAGELAVGSFANSEALAYLGRALELTPAEERDARRRLLLLCEQVHDVCADRTAQAADIEMLSSLCAPDDTRARAEVEVRRANYHLATDDFARAAQTAADAAELAHAAAWPEGEAIIHRIHGAALIPLGRYDEARARLDHALDLARGNDLAGTEDDCLRDLGLIAYYCGDYPAARRHYEQALAIDQEIGDRRGESATLVRLGALSRALGDPAAALACYQRALLLDRAIGDRDNEADGLRGIGTIEFDRGHYGAARLAYMESLAIERSSGDREGEAACLAAVGKAARALGDPAGAQDALEQALTINREIGDRHCQAEVLADLALVCTGRADHQSALGHAREALGLARSAGTRSIEGTTLARLGHAFHGLADLDGAEAAYRSALSVQLETNPGGRALDPLAGLVHVALARADRAGIRSHADTLVAALDGGVGAWSNDLPDALLNCYLALHGAGDTRAVQVLEIAGTCLENHAAQIGDAATRVAFLQDVPVHRALLAAWTGQSG